MLDVIGQAVDAGHDHPLDGVGDGDLAGAVGEPPSPAFGVPCEDAHGNEGADHLFDEERVAFGFG